MAYPEQRLRRMRMKEGLRRLARETRLCADCLVMPLFVRSGEKVRTPIPSMPGQYQFSPDELVEQCRRLASLGVGGVLLFGIPQRKDEVASQAFAEKGIVPESVRLLKGSLPDLTVITDVCLCEYMSHGHCGVVTWKIGGRKEKDAFSVDNDATLELLAKMALVHARAGVDIVAPSDMMDGRVSAIRRALDEEGFQTLPIMSYAAKYASSFYGPFREAAESSPQYGDRRSYQMDPANVREVLREVALDIDEGADIVMVKPGLGYGDVIRRVRESFRVPVAAFSVSGEYSMVKAAAEKGWLSERDVVMEVLTGLKRAGADIILTYWAEDAARWLKEAEG